MVNVIIELILILQIESKNITLRPNAVPRLFDGLHSYLFNPSSGVRSSPSKLRRLVMERHDHDQKEWLDADLLDHMMPYQDLLVIIWQIAFHCFSSTHIVIIFLCSTYKDKYSAVSITFVLRVIDDMAVYVLPDSEFSWALSLSFKW